jgi:hypothetical protein
VTDEVPAADTEEAEALQAVAAEVEGLADAWLQRLRTLSRVSSLPLSVRLSCYAAVVPLCLPLPLLACSLAGKAPLKQASKQVEVEDDCFLRLLCGPTRRAIGALLTWCCERAQSQRRTMSRRCRFGWPAWCALCWTAASLGWCAS